MHLANNPIPLKVHIVTCTRTVGSTARREYEYKVVERTEDIQIALSNAFNAYTGHALDYTVRWFTHFTGTHGFYVEVIQDDGTVVERTVTALPAEPDSVSALF